MILINDIHMQPQFDYYFAVMLYALTNPRSFSDKNINTNTGLIVPAMDQDE